MIPLAVQRFLLIALPPRYLIELVHDDFGALLGLLVLARAPSRTTCSLSGGAGAWATVVADVGLSWQVLRFVEPRTFWMQPNCLGADLALLLYLAV